MLQVAKKVGAAVATAMLTFVAQAQVVVIVNPSSSTSTLNADQVANIYLGKSNSMPGGGSAVPANLPETSPTRDAFFSKVTGKQSAQVKAIWSRLVFSGKAAPPKEFASTAEVKKFVSSTPDAIGYIEKSAADSSVKVVLSVD
ncbi:MAG: hypothetical protein J0L58_03665 [Burkholderiales bacterium]|nr:hypothetical protein [Burkholderiales bacterium]